MAPPEQNGETNGEADMATSSNRTTASANKFSKISGFRFSKSGKSKHLPTVSTFPDWYPFERAKVSDAGNSFQFDGGSLEEGNQGLKLDAVEKAVVRLQTAFRYRKGGTFYDCFEFLTECLYTAKRNAEKVFKAKVIISDPGFRDVSRMMISTYSGWNHFLCHSILFILLYLIAFFQFFHVEPRALDQEYSLLNILPLINLDDGQNYAGKMDKSIKYVLSNHNSDIQSAKDASRYFIEAMESLYSTDPEYSPDPVCAAIDESICSESRNLTYLESLYNRCSSITKESGYYDNHNRIQLGMAIRQTRYKQSDCESQTLNIYEDVFLLNGTTRKCVKDEEDREYNSNIYSTAQKPLPWDFDKAFTFHESHEDFGVLFDVGITNVPKDINICYAKALLQDYRWIDSFTKTACMSILVYNQNENGRFGLFSLCFEFPVGGSAISSVNIASTHVNHKTGATIGLTTIYAAVVFYQIYRFLRARICGRKKNSCLHNLLNTVTLVLHLLIIFLYLVYVIASDSLEYQFFVHEDLIDMLSSIQDVLLLNYVLRGLYAVIFLFMVFRSIYLLRFCEDIAFISRTMEASYKELSSFVFVFMFVTITYAFIGVLLFSATVPGFGNLWDSISSMLFMAFGEFGNALDAVYNDDSNQYAFVGPLWLWSYICVTCLLLFNVLLSIIVNAYVEVQLSKRRYGWISFKQGVVLSLEIFLYNCKHYHFSRLCCSPKSMPNPKQPSGIQFWSNESMKQKYDDLLNTPHKFSDRLNLWLVDSKTNMETFLVRKELQLIFSDGVVDRLIHLMRFRTQENRFSKAEFHKSLTYHDGNVHMLDTLFEMSTRLKSLENAIEKQTNENVLRSLNELSSKMDRILDVPLTKR